MGVETGNQGEVLDRDSVNCLRRIEDFHRVEMNFEGESFAIALRQLPGQGEDVCWECIISLSGFGVARHLFRFSISREELYGDEDLNIQGFWTNGERDFSWLKAFLNGFEVNARF